MRTKFLFLLILPIIIGCGKKLGPTSPDIWPPYVAGTKIYRDHVTFRFNEPINTDDESVIILNASGDTVPVVDTISNLQNYSVSVFPDTQYLKDTLYVILNGITDISMNKMKQYEKSFVFKNVISPGSLKVNLVKLKRIRRRGLFLYIFFNMPVEKRSFNVFAYPKRYGDTLVTFVNKHEVSFAVSDTPRFVLLPDYIRSMSGVRMQYPYLHVYKKSDFDKKKLRVDISVPLDSAINYIFLGNDSSVDIVPMGESAVLDSIPSDTCYFYIVSKNRYGFHWTGGKLRQDTLLVISNLKNKGQVRFWNNIIDKLSK